MKKLPKTGSVAFVLFVVVATLPLVLSMGKLWFLRRDLKSQQLHKPTKLHRTLYWGNLYLIPVVLYSYWMCLWPNRCASDFGEGFTMIAVIALGLALVFSIIIEFSIQGFKWAKHLAIYAFMGLVLIVPVGLFLVISRFF